MIRPIPTRQMAIRIGAIACTAGLLLACSDSSSNARSTDAGATCPKGTAIAFMGRFDQSSSVAPSSTQLGAQLAVEEFNAANPGCQISLEVEAGSGGDAAVAATAQKIAARPQVLAVVGPQRSGDVEIAGPVFESSGIPFVSATATRTDLSAQGWKMFHRIVGTNTSLGTAAAHYMVDTLGAQRIAVIDDGTPYAADLAATVTTTLGSKATVRSTITDDPVSISDVVTELSGFGAGDAVYFAGYELEAAELLHQLRSAGIDSTFVGADTLPSATFLDAAGDDAEGVIATCLCAPLTKISEGDAFGTRFGARFPEGDPNDEYAAEAFDATNLILSTVAAGNHDRSSIANALSTTPWVGITRTISFDANGDVVDPEVWVSRVSNGSFEAIASVNEHG